MPMCVLWNGCGGCGHGASGAHGGDYLSWLHTEHLDTKYSIDRYIPGNHNRLRASAFIFTILKCELCSSEIILFCNVAGIYYSLVATHQTFIFKR